MDSENRPIFWKKQRLQPYFLTKNGDSQNGPIFWKKAKAIALLFDQKWGFPKWAYLKKKDRLYPYFFTKKWNPEMGLLKKKANAIALLFDQK